MIGLWLVLALGTPAHAGEAVDAPGVEVVDADAGVIGAPGAPVTDPETLDRLTRDIGLKLRCLVCQGLTVADSSADASVAMSARVRDLLSQGYSEAQILDFFADRYGDFILLAPPKEGVHWLLWAGPLLAVGGGLVWLLARTRRSGGPPASPRTPSPDTESEDDPYRARILAELKD